MNSKLLLLVLFISVIFVNAKPSAAKDSPNYGMLFGVLNDPDFIVLSTRQQFKILDAMYKLVMQNKVESGSRTPKRLKLI